MDPTLADFLSDVAVIVGGVVTGIVVARITASRTRSLERESRRLGLLGVYLSNVETLRDQGKREQVGQPIADFTEQQDRAQAALTQLQVVAPSLERAGLELRQAAQRIVAGAQLRTIAGGRAIPEAARDPDGLDADYADKHRAFIEAAKRVVR